jgi:hypothetical protein
MGYEMTPALSDLLRQRKLKASGLIGTITLEP